MTATDEQLLLHACRENPDDDTPRLVLADWLQENGREGAAAYIRDSIAYDSGLQKPEVGKPRRRKEMGLAYKEWLNSLMPIEAGMRFFGGENWDQFGWFTNESDESELSSGRFDIRRGLPSHVSVRISFFMERAGDLFTFPIASCSINGRRPYRVDDVPPTYYRWSRASWPQKHNTYVGSSYQIPAPLFDLMSPGDANRGSTSAGAFKQLKTAISALHRAAFAYGRAQIANL